jgi:hypothetical protein
VLHLALVDRAARLDDLKPAEVLEGFVRTFERGADGILDG